MTVVIGLVPLREQRAGKSEGGEGERDKTTYDCVSAQLPHPYDIYSPRGICSLSQSGFANATNEV